MKLARSLVTQPRLHAVCAVASPVRCHMRHLATGRCLTRDLLRSSQWEQAVAAFRLDGNTTVTDVPSKWSHSCCPTALSTPPSAQATSAATPRLLVSACLLGIPVAYHGRPLHLRSARQRRSPARFLIDDIFRRRGLIECVPVCPEVDLLGLPVPRPPIRLVRAGVAAVQVSTADTGDVLLEYDPETDDMDSLSGKTASGCPRALGATSASCGTPSGSPQPSACNLRLSVFDGVLLKSRSPSCGVGDARHYHSSAKHHPLSKGTQYEESDGFFASLARRSAAVRQASVDDLPPLVFTSERLLEHFSCDAHHNNNSVCLDAFLGAVLDRFEARQHYEFQSATTETRRGQVRWVARSMNHQQPQRRKSAFMEEADVLQKIQETRMAFSASLACHERCVNNYMFQYFYLGEKTCMQNCLEKMNQVAIITNLNYSRFLEVESTKRK